MDIYAPDISSADIDVSAVFKQAEDLFLGRGCERDCRKAVALYEQCCRFPEDVREKGRAFAALGLCYDNGMGLDNVDAEIRDVCLRRAALLNDDLGRAFLLSKDVPQEQSPSGAEENDSSDDKDSIKKKRDDEMLDLAQKLSVVDEDPRGMTLLGWILGKRNKEKEGSKWTAKAAKMGHLPGNEDTPRDVDKYLELVREASDHGYPRAQCMLGLDYITGRWMNIDLKAGFDLVKQAAFKGYAPACEVYGQVLMFGKLPIDIVDPFRIGEYNEQLAYVPKRDVFTAAEIYQQFVDWTVHNAGDFHFRMIVSAHIGLLLALKLCGDELVKNGKRDEAADYYWRCALTDFEADGPVPWTEYTCLTGEKAGRVKTNAARAWMKDSIPSLYFLCAKSLLNAECLTDEQYDELPDATQDFLDNEMFKMLNIIWKSDASGPEEDEDEEEEEEDDFFDGLDYHFGTPNPNTLGNIMFAGGDDVDVEEEEEEESDED